MPLDDAMLDDGLFDKDGKGGWIRMCRMEQTPAQLIEGKG